MWKRALPSFGPVVCLLLGLGGGRALASIPSPDGTYVGCYQLSTGTLRVIDPAREACRKRREVRVTWNQRGAQGPAGVGLAVAPESRGPNCAEGGVRILDGAGNTAFVCNGQGAVPAAPICRGGPGGTCSATTAQACAYDGDCPEDETCIAPTPRFLDHGLTVTDLRTCLQWEKKTGTPGADVACVDQATCPDPHDVNNRYSWSDGSENGLTPLFNGTAATLFLAQVNGSAFAGRTDWRLPAAGPGNDPELESILSAPWPYCTTSPCIDPAFGPTAPAFYWELSVSSPTLRWVTSFGNGSGDYLPGSLYAHVRAVRGGPGVP